MALHAMPSNDRARLSPGYATHHASSLWRRSKSNTNIREQAVHTPPMPALPTMPTKTVPYIKPTPKLERAPSKMSLFHLFSKPKVEKARGHTEAGLAVPTKPQEPSKPLPSPPKSALRHNPPPQAQQTQRMRSTPMLRPTLARSPTPTRRPTSIAQEDWVPPPLFQAYPQSIKYATVQACVFSPDVLLRTQSQRRQAELIREKMSSRRDLGETLEGVPEHKKLERAHKRLVSNTVLGSTPQLTNKIYVLVTAGYVLQYAGEGPFDRLPEKILRLGKESAAFACDLIPGKHWVLQISQSASEDGTVTTTPKHSIFSRLKMQNTIARRAATSFLLVMESAEEMESWMTAVRREIENLGGMKTSEESSRASSSIDETSEKQSTEIPSHRYLAQRNPNRMSRTNPVDSPLQSQCSDSPKIVTSEWEGDRGEKTLSTTDSVSVQSRYSTSRGSVEAPSIPTTAISHGQVDLDQLRERNRYSYMSTATSISGTGTRNTSRNSSPAPTSPFREGFSSATTAAVGNAEAEPRRSATSLRSFHMSPGNATMRRRSMQPLPVTNEDSSLSTSTVATPQRHSIYGPTSPTIREPEKRALHLSTSSPADAQDDVTPTAAIRLTNDVRYSALTRPQDRQPSNPNLVRYSARSSSAPPSSNPIASPPPSRPAPTPPSSRPQSTIGGPQSPAAPPNHSERRISATPKPFFRPFPVRPQTQQNADGSIVIPRRFSSMGPTGAPAPLPLGIVVNRSVTAPVQAPPTTAATAARRQSVQHTTSFQLSPTSQPLRRPNSVQIRSNPAPFLSQSRPVRAVSSTPSFIQGKRGSVSTHASTITSTPPTGVITPSSSSNYSENTPPVRINPSPASRSNSITTPATPRNVLRGQGQQLTPPKNSLAPRRSIPNMNAELPPPAPPPNMPLPATPNAQRGVVV